MPQLMPAFFNNLILFIMLGMFITIYMAHYFILPSLLKLYLVRKYISRL